MKISGARADGAVFLDLGVSAYILKGDRVSAPTDRDVIAALGPWTEVPRDLATRRQVAQRLDRATLAPLAFFTLGGPGSGNFGHAGRPGEQGGSASGNGNGHEYTGPRREGAGGGAFGKVHERTSSPGSGNFAGRKRGVAALPPNQVARSAGVDVGNRSMRAAGRTTWNEDDYNAYAGEHNRVLDALEGREADQRPKAGEDEMDRLRRHSASVFERASKVGKSVGELAKEVSSRVPGIEGKPPGKAEHGPEPTARAKAAALKKERAEKLTPAQHEWAKRGYTGKPIMEREAKDKAFQDKLHAAAQAKRRAETGKGKKLSDDPRAWPRPTVAEIERKVLELRAIDAAAPFGGKAAPLFQKKALSDAPDEDATPTKAIVIGKTTKKKAPMQKTAMIVKPPQTETALVTKPMQRPKALATPASTPVQHAPQ